MLHPKVGKNQHFSPLAQVEAVGQTSVPASSQKNNRNLRCTSACSLLITRWPQEHAFTVINHFLIHEIQELPVFNRKAHLGFSERCSFLQCTNLRLVWNCQRRHAAWWLFLWFGSGRGKLWDEIDVHFQACYQNQFPLRGNKGIWMLTWNEATSVGFSDWYSGKPLHLVGSRAQTICVEHLWFQCSEMYPAPVCLYLCLGCWACIV